MSQPPSLFTALQHKKTLSYANVSSATLLIYDVFQLLELEIHHIWNSRWTAIKSTYLCMRYLPFIHIALVVLEDHWSSPIIRVCLGIKTSYLGLGILTFAASEFILTLRTWILWDMQRWVAVALIMFNFLIYVAGIVKMVLSIRSSRFFEPEGFLGNWGLLLVYDGVLFALLAVRAYQEHKKRLVPPAVLRQYHEAAVYYFGILALDVPCFLMTMELQDEFLPTISLIVRQLLAARIILYGRQQVHGNHNNNGESHALTTRYSQYVTF